MLALHQMITWLLKSRLNCKLTEPKPFSTLGQFLFLSVCGQKNMARCPPDANYGSDSTKTSVLHSETGGQANTGDVALFVDVHIVACD